MRRLVIVTAIVLLGAFSNALPGRAALLQVSSRTSLGTTLTIPWTTFGSVGSSLSVFQQVTVGGQTIRINSSSGILGISQQDNGFDGNFPAGTVVLTQPNPDDGQTINFVAPVLGFGTDIDAIEFTGLFTAYLAAYDSASNLIGIVSTTGTARGGIAPFIGATSLADPISFITFGLVEPGNPSKSQHSLGGTPVLGNIAIDQISVVVATPEPATWLLMAFGLALTFFGTAASGAKFGRRSRIP